jgi:hypothetical protein
LNDPGSKVKGEDWGALNYAFVAVLDPNEMKDRGFSFSSPLDSAEKYCALAVRYAKTQLSKISGAVRIGHGGLTQGYPTAIYIPVAATYDWCHAHLAEVDKREIVDAFISAYEKSGRTLCSKLMDEITVLANQRRFITKPVFLPLQRSVSASNCRWLYEVFNNVWLNRLLVEVNYFTVMVLVA